MNGKGLISKTILLALLFTISIIIQLEVNSIKKKSNFAWNFIASVSFIGN